MREPRFTIGIALTIGWIAIAGYLLLKDPAVLAKMTPSDWGSFLSGASAPLAFLWLVLGYIQQGEELKLSTEALRLQAEELKNSVQQQRDLVEVSRQQVESEREALAYEHRVREETSLPRLTPSAAGGSFRGDGESTYSFSITNYGHAATGVMADLSLPDQALHRVVDLPLLETGASQRVSFNIQGPLQGADARLWLRCTDGLGRPQSVLYSVERVDDSPHAVLLVT